MSDKFRIASEITPEQLPWGILHWVSHPPSTGAKRMTVVEGTFKPGHGHSFHKHPDREEVIYVISGTFEQWMDREMRTLRSGDAVFIPAGMVHASFNSGKGDARMIAIFGPCVGEAGFETIDVAEEAPWNGLRATKTGVKADA